MKTHKLLLFACIFILPWSIQAQKDTVPNYSHIRIPSYELSFDSTIYMVFQQVYEANLPFSYVTVPNISPVGDTRSILLSEAEGGRGTIIEPFIDLNFQGLRGRPGNPHIWQSGQVLVKYGFHTRVARSASSPILPPTNRFGLEINKTLWDNTSGVASFSFRQHDKRNWFKEIDKDLHMLYLTLEAQHYSNGQAPGVYKNSMQPVNNYAEGDFSTNFLISKLTYSHLDREDCSLLTASLGYRHDFGAEDGFLKFLPEQKENYGQHRLIGLFQWRSGPLELLPFYIKLPRFLRWFTLGRFHQKAVDSDDEYLVRSLFILTFRWETEYIMGNLDRFRLDNNKYRFNNHFYFEISPMRSRSIALLFHASYGRDYLNVRYDDIVFSWQWGISISLNKYTPIGFLSGNSIIEPLDPMKQ